MRVSFYGSSLVSCYWNGAATYYRGLLRALAERGHEITFFEPDAFGRQEHRDISDPDWCRVVVWPATGEGMARALQEGHGADLIVKASGVGVFDTELEAAVLTLRRRDNLVAFWDVDAPATARPSCSTVWSPAASPGRVGWPRSPTPPSTTPNMRTPICWWSVPARRG